jgi:hypothetical protein
MSTTPRITLPDGARLTRLGYVPEFWAAFNRLYGTFWSHGVVDQPTKEVTRLRNARITDCGF